MDKFLTIDAKQDGSKGLVFIGDKMLVYRRDSNTAKYPLKIDLPGGGYEENESPFETFKREVKEKFNLDITLENVVHAAKYSSINFPGLNAYFFVVKLSEEHELQIEFGDEGLEWMLIALNDYMSMDDVAFPILQKRAADFVSKT